MQQWFCTGLSGRRCFKQGSGNSTAPSLSVLSLSLCLEEIQIILSFCLHGAAAEGQPSMCSADTGRCKHPWTNLPRETCPAGVAGLCKIFVGARESSAQGLGVLSNQAEQKSPQKAMDVLRPWVSKAEARQRQKCTTSPKL